jgi:uncharacterized membrane protein YhaH (DUF805 family)
MSHPVSPDGTPSISPAQDSLDLPRHGATFGEAMKLFFMKYGTFEGRASRSEYWWVLLFNALVWIFCFALMAAGGVSIFDPNSEMTDAGAPGLLLFLTYYLVTVFPNWALGTRRFHDANLDESYLLCLLPYVGLPIALFLALKPSNPAGARFDRDWVSPTEQPTP